MLTRREQHDNLGQLQRLSLLFKRPLEEDNITTDAFTAGKLSAKRSF